MFGALARLLNGKLKASGIESRRLPFPLLIVADVPVEELSDVNEGNEGEEGEGGMVRCIGDGAVAVTASFVSVDGRPEDPGREGEPGVSVTVEGTKEDAKNSRLPSSSFAPSQRSLYSPKVFALSPLITPGNPSTSTLFSLGD